MATKAQREHIAGLIDTLKSHAAQLDYPPHDVRGPLDTLSFHLTEQQAVHVLENGGRLQFDCSELDAWLLKCVGLWPYSYPGFTGTFLALLPHYTDPRAANIGAMVVFGPGTGEHMATVRTPDPKGGNPLLASHGRPGFDLIRLRDEARFHSPPVTFLSIAAL